MSLLIKLKTKILLNYAKKKKILSRISHVLIFEHKGCFHPKQMSRLSVMTQHCLRAHCRFENVFLYDKQNSDPFGKLKYSDFEI